LRKKNLGQLKAALSQKSFEKASLHYIRGLEYGRIADADDSALGARGRAIEELKKAVGFEGDVANEDKDPAIHRALFAEAQKADDKSLSLKAANRWKEVADSRDLARERGEARLRLHTIQVKHALEEATPTGQKGGLLYDAQAELQFALKCLIGQPIEKDSVRGDVHELLGDVMRERGLVGPMPIQNYVAALSIRRQCGDQNGYKLISDKLSSAGAPVDGLAGGAEVSAKLNIVLAWKMLAEARLSDNQRLDAQGSLYHARHLAAALTTPDDIAENAKAGLLLVIEELLARAKC
jgi:hypothetical protein